MAVSQRTRMRQLVRRALPASARAAADGASGVQARPIHLASPGQIAVIYRWCTWVLAVGLIVTGASTTYGQNWYHRPDVYLLLGLTLAVNLLLTVALRPYMRLMRRYPPIVLLDVLFCLAVYAQSSIWTSPFQFYSYSALMLPVAIFFYTGALTGSAVFLVLNLALLYGAGDSLAWAQAHGWADTYLMQLAIVPLLAFVFAYPNRLYSQLRRAQQRLAVVEREQILLSERTRIAGSLHDNVAQLLFGIGMLAESAQARLGPPRGVVAAPDDAVVDTLRQVHDLAARGNREMRHAIYSLREPGPAGDGLPAALSGLLAELAARTIRCWTQRHYSLPHRSPSSRRTHPLLTPARQRCCCPSWSHSPSTKSPVKRWPISRSTRARSTSG
jgi:signal transduction histidine kinase